MPATYIKDNPSSLPDFNNTEQAYAHLSSGELRRALLLFQTVGNAQLVGFGKTLMQWAMALRIPIGWAIRPTIYSHFCGGETIEGCEEQVGKLHRSSVRTILDYSAEGKETEDELESTFEAILEAIKATDQDNRHAFGVFKVSGIAPTVILELVSEDKALTDDQQKAWERVRFRVAALCQEAARIKTPVFIDAEESWLQPAIDHLAEEQMLLHNHTEALVFNTVQLYRHDRLAYLKALTEKAQSSGFRLGVKLVRGAYMEKERLRATKIGVPSPIQHDKKATDRDYDAALDWCIQHVDSVSLCAGSHNEASSLLLCSKMKEAGLAVGDDRIWFAQLLGMSDPISFNLAAAGYNVAKYVPYGPIRETIPYLIRRAEENTSVAGQSSRELELIRSEFKRRSRAIRSQRT
jgi:proline dehydrogenase